MILVHPTHTRSPQLVALVERATGLVAVIRGRVVALEPRL